MTNGIHKIKLKNFSKTGNKTPVTSVSGHLTRTHSRKSNMKPQPTDSTYTPWRKWFAWKPVTVFGGGKVWFRTIYKRKRIVEWTPPQFPPNAFDTIQYATIEQVLTRKLNGED